MPYKSNRVECVLDLWTFVLSGQWNYCIRTAVRLQPTCWIVFVEGAQLGEISAYRNSDKAIRCQ